MKLTIGVFKALLTTNLWDWGKNVQKSPNMDEFSSKLFHFHFFCGVASSKSEEYFIRMTMNGMETQKLYVFASENKLYFILATVE